ncbi:MAG TPA: hypothetical protein PKA63_11545 [Oligoflexia bacterium]|nr:hypothetical protein [Oligoflexia bacterium]HMP49288.1 hypothetical protein [Oligoflexia bacterium]
MYRYIRVELHGDVIACLERVTKYLDATQDTVIRKSIMQFFTSVKTELEKWEEMEAYSQIYLDHCAMAEQAEHYD